MIKEAIIKIVKKASPYKVLIAAEFPYLAIVRIVAQYGTEAGPHIYEYVRRMKGALRP